MIVLALIQLKYSSIAGHIRQFQLIDKVSDESIKDMVKKYKAKNEEDALFAWKKVSSSIFEMSALENAETRYSNETWNVIQVEYDKCTINDFPSFIVEQSHDYQNLCMEVSLSEKQRCSIPDEYDEYMSGRL